MLGLVVVSLLGLADALYLVVSTYTGTPVLCGIVEGCNDVAKSAYSRIFGVPMSVYGVGYYLAALALSLSIMQWAPLRDANARFGGARTLLPQLMLLWAVIGVLFSLYTIYLQALVINAWCIYCIISEIATLALLTLAWPLRRKMTDFVNPSSVVSNSSQ